MRPRATSRKRLLEQHLQALNAISVALEAKDRYTEAHGRRVALYAMRLARRLAFPAQAICNVGVGALFHDVGKLALSEQILANREACLSSDLRQEVHCHPLIGAALLKSIGFLEPAVDFVLFHHEREDGSGYPFGLKAEEIPPGAKIVSIADCFDAVTTDRPYQPGQSVTSACNILREGCRGYFCETYVKVFIAEIQANGMIAESRPDPLMVDELVRAAAGYRPL